MFYVSITLFPFYKNNCLYPKMQNVIILCSVHVVLTVDIDKIISEFQMRVMSTAKFISSSSKKVKRLRRREYVPVIIERTFKRSCVWPFWKQNSSTEGCSKLKRSVDMTSSGKNGLNIRTNAKPKWDRTRCPEE